ncbi:U3 small nucleolar RNA-associated protein 25 [Striga asiatica]|uniref:U3 small nucleolar RNA-associated protein 25 n=1 Tax=Striga asiatica TaxID=4170 RepID=A0A5A7QND6_STRAF|nr:U3 small nucleolar RNA-associated protein 25 [Striga asiatica]
MATEQSMSKRDDESFRFQVSFLRRTNVYWIFYYEELRPADFYCTSALRPPPSAVNTVASPPWKLLHTTATSLDFVVVEQTDIRGSAADPSTSTSIRTVMADSRRTDVASN